MDALRVQLAGAEDQLQSVRGARQRLDDIARILDGFRDVWQMLVPEERREVVQLLVDRVTVDHEARGLRIVLHDLDTPVAGDPS